MRYSVHFLSSAELFFICLVKLLSFLLFGLLSSIEMFFLIEIIYEGNVLHVRVCVCTVNIIGT